MDPATLLGMGLAFVVIVIATILEGGNPVHMLLLPPMLLVFGATLGVTIAGGTMADAKNAVKSIKRAFTGKAESGADVVPTIVDLADTARKLNLPTS